MLWPRRKARSNAEKAIDDRYVADQNNAYYPVPYSKVPAEMTVETARMELDTIAPPVELAMNLAPAELSGEMQGRSRVGKPGY